ncbi:cofactor assembly of complex C subunit B [Leptolyngbya ohadii]|uniref:cofactor assembly of complex C subunit B n=1 Tax=Leptolyngbya ohadii TaxID=1962290 RepID=UPI000B59D609|nr:cofactor assembly of complex C subunit B [Leptolyngbya ohadii]
MQTSILSSTALLTLLLAVGLFFFIRASTKDRIEVAKLMSDQSEESLLDGLKQYFGDRAYRVIALDAEQNQVTFEGFVRPSLFLAIFLSSLAAIGIFCLVLVLSYLFPNAGNVLLLLLLLAPGAGVFYWKKSARLEQVAVKVEPDQVNQPHRFLTVTGHRDELAELQRSLNLKAAE